MFCGFVDALNSPRYCPPPAFDIVPNNCPVELTNTCNVALLLVLVASTRNTRLSLSYSARVTLTVSVDGGGGVVADGLIVNVALRVTPFNVALIVAVPVAVTAVVPTVNVPDDAPAAIVTLAGTVARVLLLARLTTVAAGALALNVTVP